MKQVIRRGVFETNSSSSHAVSLCRKKDDERWRTEDEIPEEEKEIRSAYEKMLFVWNFICRELNTDELYDWENKESFSVRPKVKAELDAYRRIFFEELQSVQSFDSVEANEEMNYCIMHAHADPLCCRFFNEDVLADCTCNITLEKIANFLGVKHPLSCDEGKREFAQKLFSDDFYFKTEEGWFGGCWVIYNKIF